MNKKQMMVALMVVILMLCMAFTLSGCNQKLLDVTYKYDYAWISLPNGDVVEGAVQSWTDFEDGDQIQVKVNGVTYLTDTTRCVLASGYKG